MGTETQPLSARPSRDASVRDLAGTAARGAIWHTGLCEVLYERFEADPVKGLTEVDAKARLATYGTNELPSSPPPSAWKRIIAQFANPIVLTLLAAAVVATVNGASNSKAGVTWLARFGDAVAIALIVVLNAVLGFYQERRAEAALDALKKMQTPNARVRRDDQV
ncbi:MAG: P-type Ca2+ transporter type, partial [Myxococcales bacterium]|nr:P-type Ca2+ transporter type [Myxococcales bacterium]